jgi:WD40 repeat protein
MQRKPPRVVFWNAVLPVVPTITFTSGGPVQDSHPVRAFSIATDSRIVAGGIDRFVHAWDHQRPIWSSGPWSTGFALSGNSWTFTPFGAYRLHDFAARDSLDLIVQRIDTGKEHSGRTRTQIFDAADGHQHTSQSQADHSAGYSIATTPDFAYEVVASEVHGWEWALDLWSPRNNRHLKRLGRYRFPQANFVDPLYPIGASPFFSPLRRWLFVPAPDATGRGIEFWRLPEAVCVGTALTIPPESARGLSIDPEETLAVRIGSQVFELASCKKRCDLESAIRGAYEIVITDENMMLSFEGSDQPSPHHTWDLTTGKKSILGATLWTQPWVMPTRLRLHPDGSRLLVHGTVGHVVSRPGTPSPAPVPPPIPGSGIGPIERPDGVYRVELWDVPKRHMLRQIDLPVQAGSSPQIWWDNKSFYLSGGSPASSPAFGGPNPAQRLSCYSWSDGRDLPPPSETLIAHLASASSPREFGPYPEVSKWSGAVWRGRDGLSLQIGWDPKHILLADSNRLPPSLPFTAHRVGRQLGQVNRNDKILVFPYDLAMEGSSGQWPRTTDIWDARTGRRVVSLPDSETFATADPTGAWLASFDRPGAAIKIYEAATGRPTHRVNLKGLPGRMTELDLWWRVETPLIRLHPGGDRLVLAHQGILYLWDAGADRAVCRVDRPVHFTPVDCVAQSAATRLAASAAGDGVILLWDRDSGRFVRDLVGHAGGILSLDFHPDGTRLASSAQDGSIIIWDVEGKPLWRYGTGKPGEVGTSIAFNPPGYSLFVGTSSGRLHKLDVKTGEPQGTFEVGTSSPRLGFSPSGSRLILAGAEGKVISWDPRLGRTQRRWDVGHAITSLATVGEQVVAIGSKAIEFWDATSGLRLMTHELPNGPALDMKFDASTNELLVVAQDHAISIVDLGAIDRQLAEMNLDFLKEGSSKPAP